MSKTGHIFTAKKAFLAVLLLAGFALLVLAPKTAVNVDEQLHYPHAKRVVNWYFTGGEDQSCLHTPQTNLKYYGQSVDNFTALFNRVFNVKDEFLVRHCTGAVFFWLLLFFSGLLAREITGSWLMATVSILSLIFMPRLAGQAFGNLKDIPFATGYVAGLLMSVRFLKELPSPRWRTAILLGSAIAFTVSVRSGGFILFAYLALGMIAFFVWKPFYLKQVVTTKPVFVRLLGQGTIILIIGYFAGQIFWPFALQNILVHPLESLNVMSHYKVSIRQVFDGQMMWSTQLPWYYLPKWMLISTPMFVLAGFLFFLCFFSVEIFFKKHFSQQLFFEAFILFSFLFPFFYVIVIDSNLYSGVRQMLFILPPLAILAVWGVFRLVRFVEMKNRKTSYILSLFFLALLGWPAKHQAATFPVDYVYFNVLAGGNEKAWGNYEYDYYFHGLKEPAEYVLGLAGSENAIVAMNCNLSNYFDDHPNIRYQYSRFLERSSFDWDYGIFGVNYIDPELLKNELWQPADIIKTFYQKGNPVAVVVKRTSKDDFLGISELNKGNFGTGVELLEKAVKKDSNNVWLFVNLAKAKLAEGSMTEFEVYLNKGKEIFPRFEPFFLLEATRFYEEGKYVESFQKLNALFEINPRYLPAKELLEKVKEKLG